MDHNDWPIVGMTHNDYDSLHCIHSVAIFGKYHAMRAIFGREFTQSALLICDNRFCPCLGAGGVIQGKCKQYINKT